MGMSESTASKSFENRMMIRPSGVVSKKRIGERIMRSRSREWMATDDFLMAKATAIEPTAIKTAVEKCSNEKNISARFCKFFASSLYDLLVVD